MFKLTLYCSDRAAFRACSAVDAFVGVDFVFTAVFGNCTYGAGICAGTACDALVIDFVCHSLSP